MSLITEEGVKFELFTLPGLHILHALEVNARNQDLVITSGTDGLHSGQEDPHHKGNAYDVRSKDLVDKSGTFSAIMNSLEDGTPESSSGGLVTTRFFGWLENPDTDNEHFHFQLRHGVTY